jgi:hypothetical protein
MTVRRQAQQGAFKGRGTLGINGMPALRREPRQRRFLRVRFAGEVDQGAVAAGRGRHQHRRTALQRHATVQRLGLRHGTGHCLAEAPDVERAIDCLQRGAQAGGPAAAQAIQHPEFMLHRQEGPSGREHVVHGWVRLSRQTLIGRRAITCHTVVA